MATVIRPLAAVTIDNPHADGLITAQSYEQHWTFATPHQQDAVGGNQAEFPLHNGTEYLAALGAVKPIGSHPPTDMAWRTDGDGWYAVNSVYDGVPDPETYWRISKPAVVSPRMAFMEYYDSRPDKFGLVVNTRFHTPNCSLVLIREAPAENSTGYARYVAVSFWGNDNLPGCKRYTLILPLADSDYRYPYLLAADFEDTGTGDVVAVWEAAGGFLTATGPRIDTLWFEVVQDTLVVRMEGVAEPLIWQYPDLSGIITFRNGPVAVLVKGHAAQVWLSEIDYNDADVATAGYQYVSSDLYNTTRDWTYSHFTPTSEGWSLSVAEETDGDYHRPRLSFVQAGASSHFFPVCYFVKSRAAATQGSAVSSPDALDGSSAVHRVDYTLRHDGTNQTCTINLVDRTNARTWRGNNKVTVEVGWQDSDAVAATTQKFAGYVALDGIDYEAQFDRTSTGRAITLSCADPIEARLSKKYMVNTGPAAGMHLAQWVYNVLWDGGVPASQLTDISAMISSPTVPTISHRPIRGELRGLFGANVSRVDALDEIVTGQGYEWGWNGRTSLYFLRLPITYSGIPDATLGDDALIWDVAFAQSMMDFRNYLHAVADVSGAEYQYFVRDTNSHYTTSDDAFIGDDWWQTMLIPDADGPAAVAQRWAQLQRHGGLLTWTQRGAVSGDTALKPGDFVQWNGTKHNTPAGTIFLITQERGTLVAGDSRRKTWICQYEAQRWET